MIIETHAHLDFPDFADDLDAVVQRATEAGVERIVTIGTSVEESRRAVAIAERYPSVFAAVGIHPNSAIEAEPDAIEQLRLLARNPRVVAIGEAGLDYFRLPGEGSESPEALVQREAIKAAQARCFIQQLDLAVELGLNVVIHQRGDCWDDTLAILQPYTGKLRAVFHCFGGTLEQARSLLAQGHLVSFTGIVTFKNAPVAQQTATNLPTGSFMVETDCPFLAPVPHRGQRCEPAYTRLVAEKIAQLRGVSLDVVARETTAVAREFFRLP